MPAEPFAWGEGRSSRGRNEKKNSRKHRNRGSDICRKIENNTGKYLLSAGACGNPQKLVTQDVAVEVIEIIGLAHEFVVAMNAG